MHISDIYNLLTEAQNYRILSVFKHFWTGLANHVTHFTLQDNKLCDFCGDFWSYHTWNLEVFGLVTAENIHLVEKWWSPFYLFKNFADFISKPGIAGILSKVVHEKM